MAALTSACRTAAAREGMDLLQAAAPSPRAIMRAPPPLLHEAEKQRNFASLALRNHSGSD